MANTPHSCKFMSLSSHFHFIFFQILCLTIENICEFSNNFLFVNFIHWLIISGKLPMSLPMVSLPSDEFETARLLLIDGFKRLYESIMGHESLQDHDLVLYCGLLQTVCGFIRCFEPLICRI